MLDSGRARPETEEAGSPEGAGPVFGGAAFRKSGTNDVAYRDRFLRDCVGLACLAIGGLRADGADLVTLDGWVGQGVVVQGNGMTPDVVRLSAEARWTKAADRDPLHYRVRVTLPDGRQELRGFPAETPPPGRRFAVYIPADPIRNLPPRSVRVVVAVVEAGSGAAVSNDLEATIADMPRPRGEEGAVDPGPFGYARDFDGEGKTLPGTGPDGFKFARIPASADGPGFYLATTEATNKQLGDRLPGYDPKAGRSDEFSLEGAGQPALGLSIAKAGEYLNALGKADPAGIGYRAPSVGEWTRAAKGGQSTLFWWGDEATFPEGANLLGPEPAQPGDATAPSLSPGRGTTFKANPFGLYHTFGNVAEWASNPAGGSARMGGDFRSEPAAPQPEVLVHETESIGPDPFVGVRPAFDLTPEAGAKLAANALATDPALANVRAAFDPDRALVTLTGTVAEPSGRRLADRAMEQLWFVASVNNRIETPGSSPNQLASLAAPVGPMVRRTVLDRTFLDLPIAVRWSDPLPVAGSEWWVNLYFPGGQHLAHRMAEGGPGRANRLRVTLNRDSLAELNLGDDTPFSVALSLGTPAPNPADAHVVSNLDAVRPAAPAKAP